MYMFTYESLRFSNRKMSKNQCSDRTQYTAKKRNISLFKSPLHSYVFPNKLIFLILNRTNNRKEHKISKAKIRLRLKKEFDSIVRQFDQCLVM